MKQKMVWEFEIAYLVKCASYQNIILKLIFTISFSRDSKYDDYIYLSTVIANYETSVLSCSCKYFTYFKIKYMCKHCSLRLAFADNIYFFCTIKVK